MATISTSGHKRTIGPRHLGHMTDKLVCLNHHLAALWLAKACIFSCFFLHFLMSICLKLGFNMPEGFVLRHFHKDTIKFKSNNNIGSGICITVLAVICSLTLSLFRPIHYTPRLLCSCQWSMSNILYSSCTINRSTFPKSPQAQKAHKQEQVGQGYEVVFC